MAAPGLPARSARTPPIVTEDRLPGAGLGAGALAVLAIVGGLVLAAVCASTLFARMQDWGRGQPIPSRGAVTLHLVAGDQLVYQVCGAAAPCPDVAATQVTVTERATGQRVATSDDGSDDRLADPAHEVPVVGAVAFRTPRAGRYRLVVTGPRGRELLVALSPGGFLRSVLGWLVLAAVSVLAVLGGALALLVRHGRRVRARRAQALGGPPAARPGANPRIVSR